MMRSPKAEVCPLTWCTLPRSHLDVYVVCNDQSRRWDTNARECLFLESYTDGALRHCSSELITHSIPTDISIAVNNGSCQSRMVVLK